MAERRLYTIAPLSKPRPPKEFSIKRLAALAVNTSDVHKDAKILAVLSELGELLNVCDVKTQICPYIVGYKDQKHRDAHGALFKPERYTTSKQGARMLTGLPFVGGQDNRAQCTFLILETSGTPRVDGSEKVLDCHNVVIAVRRRFDVVDGKRYQVFMFDPLEKPGNEPDSVFLAPKVFRTVLTLDATPTELKRSPTEWYWGHGVQKDHTKECFGRCVQFIYQAAFSPGTQLHTGQWKRIGFNNALKRKPEEPQAPHLDTRYVCVLPVTRIVLTCQRCRVAPVRVHAV